MADLKEKMFLLSTTFSIILLFLINFFFNYYLNYLLFIFSALGCKWVDFVGLKCCHFRNKAEIITTLQKATTRTTTADGDGDAERSLQNV